MGNIFSSQRGVEAYEATSLHASRLSITRDPEPKILIVDPSPVHLRSYDAEAGDRRFFGREGALAVARLRAKDRGCRQQVRRVTVEPGDAALVPPWLVQDI